MHDGALLDVDDHASGLTLLAYSTSFMFPSSRTVLCLLLASLNVLAAVADPIHIPIRRRTRSAPVDLNERARRLRARYGFEDPTTAPTRASAGLVRRAASVSVDTTNHVRVMWLSKCADSYR